MLKLDEGSLENLEKQHPGVLESIRRFESAILPLCPACGSEDIAQVTCGLVGFSIKIAAATTKMKLLPNGPAPGKYCCNTCKTFFADSEESPKKLRNLRK